MKKRIVSSAVALIAATTFAAAPAAASDLFGSKDNYTAPAPIWTGFYVGGRLGYGNANHDLSLHDYFKDYCYDAPNGGVDANGNEILLQPIDAFDTNGAFGDPRTGLPGGISLARVTAVPEGGCESLNGKTFTGNEGGNEVRYKADGYATVSGDSREISRLDGVNTDGIVGGVQLGLDKQLGSWVVGAFGSYTFSNMDAKFSALTEEGNVSGSIEKGDEWSAGIRIGRLLSPETLLYGLVAYSQTDYDFSVTNADGTETKNVDFDGVTVGGGIEHALTNNVFIGIEGTHTFYGEETVYDEYDADHNVGEALKDDLSETKVMGTLKLKLTGGY